MRLMHRVEMLGTMSRHRVRLVPALVVPVDPVDPVVLSSTMGLPSLDP
jgi:hypothetical protein